jgi:hypothetical protein
MSSNPSISPSPISPVTADKAGVLPAAAAEPALVGSKGWTALENLAYFQVMLEKQIAEDASESDEVWKQLGAAKDTQGFPNRAPTALRSHIKEMISDVRSMTSSFSSANALVRCPTFDDYSKSVDAKLKSPNVANVGGVLEETPLVCAQPATAEEILEVNVSIFLFGSCLICVNFNDTLLSFIISAKCLLDNSKSLNLSFNLLNKTSIVEYINLLFLFTKFFIISFL